MASALSLAARNPRQAASQMVLSPAAVQVGLVRNPLCSDKSY
jgi:hypothetical protein